MATGASADHVLVGPGRRARSVWGSYTRYPLNGTVGGVTVCVERRFREVLHLRANLRVCLRRLQKRNPKAGAWHFQLPVAFADLDEQASIRGAQRLAPSVVAARQGTLQRCFQALLDECPYLLLERPMLAFLGLLDRDLCPCFVERAQVLAAPDLQLHKQHSDASVVEGLECEVRDPRIVSAGSPPPECRACIPLRTSRTRRRKSWTLGGQRTVPGLSQTSPADKRCAYTQYTVVVRYPGCVEEWPRGKYGEVLTRRFRDFVDVKRNLEAKAGVKLPAVWKELEAERRSVWGVSRLQRHIVCTRRVLLHRCLQAVLQETPHLLLDPDMSDFLRLYFNRLPQPLKDMAWRKAFPSWDTVMKKKISS